MGKATGSIPVSPTIGSVAGSLQLVGPALESAVTAERTEVNRAAAALARHHRQTGTVMTGLPDAMRPRTRADAYAIQACLEMPDQPLFGWKIAATSSAGQAHINVEGPLAGRLLRDAVVPYEDAVELGANRMRVAEIEFAFRMGRDLPPRAEPYAESEVMAAVDTLFLAVEVPDSRFADFCAVGANQLIADNACAHLFVLGPEAAAVWREMDLAETGVTGRIAGKLTHAGAGRNVLGDPKTALTWLANELSTHGITLAAGQVVTTGTCVTPLPVSPGDVVTGDFGELGLVRVAFTS